MATQKRPTRIVEKPQIVKGRFIYLCDDGRSYTSAQLAALLGIHIKTFNNRFTRLGWAHPDILAPRLLDRRSSQFGKLGSVVRNERLSQIPGPTKFDLMFG